MRLFTTLLIALVGLVSVPARAADYYILGVQDYVKNPILVVRDYQSLASYLSRTLKVPVRIEAVKTYDDYIKKAKNKRFHFMYAPPSMIMQASLSAGYEPVVKIPGLLSASLTGTASLVGVVSGDVVNPGGTPTGVFVSATVGTNKAVTVTGVTLSGADASNYTVTQPTTTANITTKALTVTAVAASKVYGAVDPTFTYTVSGLVSPDTEGTVCCWLALPES